MASKSSYANLRLLFQFDNFTPIDDDDCGLYFLSSNTVMLCLAFLQHYGKLHSRYYYDLNAQNPQRLTEDDYNLIFEIVDKAIKELMTDACKSLQEIEFTLKHMLTVFSRDKKVFWEIEKPPEPTAATGATYISKSRYDSSFDYNVILDAGNPTNPGSNQLWGMGDLMAKAFLEYENSAHAPHVPVGIVVESLLKMGGTKSLEEIEYTLKTLLTILGKDKEIKIYIDKPVAATAGDNATLEVNRESVFEVSSLLETNNVTEILQIALLDDGTLQLPDINPFNLESKLDKIHDMVETQATNHNLSLTYIWKTFYAGLDINPFLDESFFSLIRRSFQDRGFGSDEPFLQKLNVMYEMANFQGVAAFTNAYSYYFYTWINGTFSPLMTAMKDCVCGIKTAVQGLSLSPVINVAPANPLITVEGGDVINVMPATPTITVSPTPITNNINVSPTPVNITNNVDACCDDGTQPPVITPPETSYPPINPDLPVSPTNPTTKPYDPNSPKPLIPTVIDMQSDVSLRNAYCGYNYYTVGKVIDFVDWLLDWVDLYEWIATSIGLNGQVDKLILEWGGKEIPGGVWIAKLPLTVLRTILSKAVFIVGVLDTFSVIQETLEIWRNEMSCELTGNDNINDAAIDGNHYRNLFTNFALRATVLDDAVIEALGFIIGTCIDYDMFNPLSLVVNIEDYAQYCPCPEEVPNGLTGSPLMAFGLNYSKAECPFYGINQAVIVPYGIVEGETSYQSGKIAYISANGGIYTFRFEYSGIALKSISPVVGITGVIGVYDIKLQYNQSNNYTGHVSGWLDYDSLSEPSYIDSALGGTTVVGDNGETHQLAGNWAWELDAVNNKLIIRGQIKLQSVIENVVGGVSIYSTTTLRICPKLYVTLTSDPVDPPITPLSLTDNGDGTVTVDFSGVDVPAGATTTLTVNGQAVTGQSGTSYTTPPLAGEVTVVMSVAVNNPDGSVTTTVYTEVVTVTQPCVNPPTIVDFGYTLDGLQATITWQTTNGTWSRLYKESENFPRGMIASEISQSGEAYATLNADSITQFWLEVDGEAGCEMLTETFSIDTTPAPAVFMDNPNWYADQGMFGAANVNPTWIHPTWVKGLVVNWSGRSITTDGTYSVWQPGTPVQKQWNFSPSPYDMLLGIDMSLVDLERLLKPRLSNWTELVSPTGQVKIDGYDVGTTGSELTLRLNYLRWTDDVPSGAHNFTAHDTVMGDVFLRLKETLDPYDGVFGSEFSQDLASIPVAYDDSLGIFRKDTTTIYADDFDGFIGYYPKSTLQAMTASSTSLGYWVTFQVHGQGLKPSLARVGIYGTNGALLSTIELQYCRYLVRNEVICIGGYISQANYNTIMANSSFYTMTLNYLQFANETA